MSTRAGEVTLLRSMTALRPGSAHGSSNLGSFMPADIASPGQHTASQLATDASMCPEAAAEVLRIFIVLMASLARKGAPTFS